MKLEHLHIDSNKVFQDFDIDFCIESKPADIIVIAGINGSGKTTLLKEIDNQYPEDVLYLPASDGSGIYDLQSHIANYVDKIVYEDGKTSTEAYRDIQRSMDSVFKDFNVQVRFNGLNRDRKLVFTNAHGDKFDMEALSSGERQILGKVFPLFIHKIKKGLVILMDEPEESLHPSWQSCLVPILRQYAKENDCQFILATHSPQIISSVRKEELRLLVRDENSYVRAVTCSEGPYGWTVEKVLSEIQDVQHFRVPEVEDKLERLRKMIEERHYETDEFHSLWDEMEELLGYSDTDLILMRMEIIRKKKQ
ncbi:hemin importer ATP-binding subunit [Bacteroidales bacterium Barb6]|nr:hemin importer ATP-binding subunit [Bacteroidales bacterium Barb6]